MNSPSITDWISSIGVLIALPAGLWSIVQLFKKDKEKEAKINSLVKIAEETSIQSKYLSYQVKEMQESNKILNKQFELLEKSYLFNQQQVESEQEMLKLAEEKRRLKIRPYFNFVKIGLDLHLNLASLSIVNVGERAILKDYYEYEKNSVEINYFDKKEVDNLKIIYLQLNPKMPGIKIDECFILFDLIFEDEDMNRYKQKIEGYIKGGNAFMDQPVVIENI